MHLCMRVAAPQACCGKARAAVRSRSIEAARLSRFQAKKARVPHDGAAASRSDAPSQVQACGDAPLAEATAKGRRQDRRLARLCDVAAAGAAAAAARGVEQLAQATGGVVQELRGWQHDGTAACAHALRGGYAAIGCCCCCLSNSLPCELARRKRALCVVAAAV